MKYNGKGIIHTNEDLSIEDLVRELKYHVRFGGFKVIVYPTKEDIRMHEEVGMEAKIIVFRGSGYMKEDDHLFIGEKYEGQKNVRVAYIGRETKFKFEEYVDTGYEGCNCIIEINYSEEQ